MQDRVGGVLTRLPGLKAAGGKLKALAASGVCRPGQPGAAAWRADTPGAALRSYTVAARAPRRGRPAWPGRGAHQGRATPGRLLRRRGRNGLQLCRRPPPACAGKGASGWSMARASWRQGRGCPQNAAGERPAGIAATAPDTARGRPCETPGAAAPGSVQRPQPAREMATDSAARPPGCRPPRRGRWRDGWPAPGPARGLPWSPGDVACWPSAGAAPGRTRCWRTTAAGAPCTRPAGVAAPRAWPPPSADTPHRCSAAGPPAPALAAGEPLAPADAHSPGGASGGVHSAVARQCVNSSSRWMSPNPSGMGSVTVWSCRASRRSRGSSTVLS